MKMLSLIQPWASLIDYGHKHIETRSWPTYYRGLVGIHASKGFPRHCQRLLEEEPFLTALNCPPEELSRGAVVAVARLVDCRPTWHQRGYFKPGSNGAPVAVPEPELSFGDYTDGRFAFLLRDVRSIRPIPAKGALGLWSPGPELEAQIRAQLPDLDNGRLASLLATGPETEG